VEGEVGAGGAECDLEGTGLLEDEEDVGFFVVISVGSFCKKAVIFGGDAGEADGVGV
jgi:hypothetical protein